MSINVTFDWKYLTTNADNGITSIVLKIVRHLEPKDIQKLKRVNQDFKNFIEREKPNIYKGYRNVTLKFPQNDWNQNFLNSIWYRSYFTEKLSDTHNVITE